MKVQERIYKFVDREYPIIFMVTLAFVLLMSCAHVNQAKVERDGYRTLVTLANSYNVLKATAQELYDDGQLTGEQADKLNSMAKIYRVAYHSAVDALELYGKGLQTDEDIAAALTEVSNILSRIQELVDETK